MKRTDQERLLNDVLADEAETGPNAASLDQLLQLARRQRRVRLVRRACGVSVIAVVVMSAFLFQSSTQKPQTELARKPIMPASYETVVSFALKSEQLVGSQPLLPEQMVLADSAVTVIYTTEANFQPVNDEQLLELTKPNIAVLVRRGPHEAELVFVEPATANN
jgi:hypothetical protein